MKTIILDNIRIPVEKAFRDGLDTSILSAARQRLGTADFEYDGLFHKSIDARRKGKINHVLSVKIKVDDSFDSNGIKNSRILKKKDTLRIKNGDAWLNHPPVIAGSGPCGLMCAYTLSIYGFSPIVLERGRDIDRRYEDVRKFWKTGLLDINSNVQFGEGGAGTFSDGKLVTRINDHRCSDVIDLFLKHGAPLTIRYEAKPHIGTDALRPVIKGIREEIISLGGRFLYESELTGINFDGGVKSVTVNNEYELPADIVVLAIGHSARDTYEMLFDSGFAMEPKPFSAGVRIEHLQDDVNHSQWGNQARFIDSAAEYSLSRRAGSRAAYTFCMCPGGVVVNASSEEKSLTINGMSYHERRGRNANSAWVAEVKPSDLGSGHPLGGLAFQREIEKQAYYAGGGGFRAPVQLLGDFLKGLKSSAFGRVRSSFTGATSFCDLNSVLPGFITAALKDSAMDFGKRLSCFQDHDAVLTGCETRTSAPLRILRNKEFESLSVKGVYPAGEGAGYAGGIMSAAVDGIKVAETIIKLYNYSG